MAKVLLLGASGLVGAELLCLLEQDSRVSRIVAPTRQPLASLSKLVNPVGNDLPALVAGLTEPIDLFFCCLGTTRKQAGSTAAFHDIEFNMVVNSALSARQLGANHCLVVSANGANPGSRLYYNRTKGLIEQALIAQEWPLLTLIRPSLLVGQRQPPRRLEQLSVPLFKLLPGKWKAIDALDVAKAMQQQAFNAGLGGITVLESDQLAAIAHQ